MATKIKVFAMAVANEPSQDVALIADWIVAVYQTSNPALCDVEYNGGSVTIEATQQEVIDWLLEE